MLATGITPEQMLAIMAFVEETLASSPNMSRSGEQTGHEGGGLSVNRSSIMTSLSEIDDELVTVHDQLEPNSSQLVTSSDKQTGHEQVIGCDISEENWSRSVTSPPIHEKKLHEKNMTSFFDSSSSKLVTILGREHDVSETSFFDILATALAKAGYPGIRSAQFADLTGFLWRTTRT